MKYLLITFLLTTGLKGFSQNDSLNKLEEVILYGNFSPSLSSGYSVKVINDSVLKSENISLGILLQKKLNLYLKENGNGMVSSISLRGTSAAHTGVYWNGIPVNSSLNGQTDFNTISAFGFDAVDIRKGGGSVLLGSGAVGGAINLRDQLEFKPQRSLFVQAGAGSYKSYNGYVQLNLASDTFFGKLTLNNTGSKNDYPYPDSDLKNENGTYKNIGFQTVLGWKPGQNNILTFYSYYADSDRNTSRTLTAPSNAKLLNKNNRMMFSWKNTGINHNSDLKLSFLDEKYTYLFNKDIPKTAAVNQNSNYIVKYDLSWFLKNKAVIKTGMINTYAVGKGDNIGSLTQNDLEIYGLWHHKLLKNVFYDISIRKGFSSKYEIPFVYAADLIFKITDKWNVKSNYSTNYRLPTFNDLYWVPGGNPNLRSERTQTGEVGFIFNDRGFKIEASSYFLKGKDIIQWVPVTSDFWQPENIAASSGYGFEMEIQTQKNIGKHRFRGDIQYAYTVSKDDHLDKQLIYVPYHKGNGNLLYQYKKAYINYNLQYTGSIFTTSTNTESLDDYWISNLELGYGFFKNKMNLSLVVDNLFNKAYQNVAYRPMPGINYQMNINYKID